MLLNKLKWHLETIVFTQKISVPNNALLASFKVGIWGTKYKKPYTIVEELILLTALDMVNIMLLFYNTISQRIHDVAEILYCELIEKI